ncbi:hypothetical protein [Mycoplasmopsis alligatoris]|uniref:Lipoprotein n=1 Tax=Mycoplasmopsis alligatoris A21JP2 TaxID=747682 RepID=D4XWP2_9BACT|nr:hypothetical protein [Mycoplasmopsis alligatoris]EFF41321.1 hypothetical protein MALL_0386 [Mycoplasmopsis alligatoris A21JP2]
MKKNKLKLIFALGLLPLAPIAFVACATAKTGTSADSTTNAGSTSNAGSTGTTSATSQSELDKYVETLTSRLNDASNVVVLGGKPDKPAAPEGDTPLKENEIGNFNASVVGSNPQALNNYINTAAKIFDLEALRKNGIEVSVATKVNAKNTKSVDVTLSFRAAEAKNVAPKDVTFTIENVLVNASTVSLEQMKQDEELLNAEIAKLVRLIGDDTDSVRTLATFEELQKELTSLEVLNTFLESGAKSKQISLPQGVRTRVSLSQNTRDAKDVFVNLTLSKGSVTKVFTFELEEVLPKVEKYEAVPVRSNILSFLDKVIGKDEDAEMTVKDLATLQTELKDLAGLNKFLEKDSQIHLPSYLKLTKITASNATKETDAKVKIDLEAVGEVGLRATNNQKTVSFEFVLEEVFAEAQAKGIEVTKKFNDDDQLEDSVKTVEQLNAIIKNETDKVKVVAGAKYYLDFDDFDNNSKDMKVKIVVVKDNVSSKMTLVLKNVLN